MRDRAKCKFRFPVFVVSHLSGKGEKYVLTCPSRTMLALFVLVSTASQ